MLLTETVIYFLAFTKREKTTLAEYISPASYLWFVSFGGRDWGVWGGSFWSTWSRDHTVLLSFLCSAKGSVLAVRSNCATKSLKMV